MDCHDARESLEEFRRGELPPDAARSVETHLARCPACRQLREREDALAALARGLPRPSAPAALRRRVEAGTVLPGRLHRWLARPAVAAALAALAVAAGLSPWVSFRGPRPPDPVETLVAAGVTEHRRILLQLQSGGGEVTDVAAAFATVRALTDVQLPSAFAGSGDLHLVAARPTLIANRKAGAAVLSYRAESVTTYFALPGKDLPMPSDRRVQIEQYRPYMRQVESFQVVYWKQGDVAYLMVTNVDDPRARQLFLEMRKAM